MKSCCQTLAFLFLMLLTYAASASTLYVNLNSITSVSPYSNWSTAATNIQDAVDAASAGDTVLVTNGVYATGGRRWFDSGTNRVTLTNAITLLSVNGPAVTLIVGSHASGPGLALTNAVRCVGLGNNAVLSGFTLTNGEGGWGNYPAGGGVANLVSISAAGTVTNCVLIGNLSTNAAGGGAYRVRLVNCQITGNSATYGGGACACTLTNCTVAGNTATYGGGVYGDTTFGASALVNCTIAGNSASSSGGGVNNGGSGAMDNCVVYYNMAPSGSNYTGIKLNYCCTTPTLTGDLTSFTNPPLFANLVAGDYHLNAGSPCINAGNNSFITNRTDLDGNARIVDGTVDLGAYENQNTNPVHYVSLTSANPLTPFTSWSTAARNIQDAVGAAQTGDLVIVDTGIYSLGGTVIYGSETNRVALTNGITLLSLNGPGKTVIVGGTQTRCVYVGSNSVVSGFTIAAGAGRNGGDITKEQSGGGIWCEPGGVVSNCVISSNACGFSSGRGGGIYGGTVYNSTLSGNTSAYGGGAAAASLFNCMVVSNALSNGNYGGGVYQGMLSNCTLTANWAYFSGGGAYQSTLYNCTVNGNSSSQLGGGVYQGNNFNCLITGNKSSIGGGAYQSTNYNCIITGNTAGQGGGLYLATIINCTVASNSASIGGGIYAGIAFNSIIDFNSASGGGANWTNSPYFYHCCTTPQPNVYAGNITNDPLFVDVAGGDLRLKCGSPCIDTGSTNYFSPIGILTAPANDFRDVPRPLDGDGDGITQFDMGAYEYNPAIDQIPVIRAAFTFTGFATHYAVPFIGEIGGCADYFWWDFGDGTTVTNQSNVSHAWSSSGTYSVVLTAYYSSLGHGLSATAQVQVVQPPIYYASVSSPIPTPPYTNWLTAAHTIQQAIAAGTTPGRLVLVTNGLYQTPGVIVYGATYNNLALTDPVVVQSVNGPGVTTVSPFQGRCAYVGNNAILSGFTLAGGHVLSSSGDISQEQSGGGVWCEPGGVVSNCVIAGNLANYYGGGAYQGTFYNCVMTNNSVGFNGANAAQGNGVFGGTLHDCTVIGNTSFGTTTGGGASQSTLYHCLLTGNSATWGGGANLSTLYSCTVSGNRSAINGGGAYSNTLWNCVLAGNTANNGGGAYASTLHNCLVISNQAFNTGGGLYSGALFNCTVANNTAATGGGIYGTIPSPVDNSILFDNTAWSSGNNWQGSLIGSNNCTFPLLPPTAWGNITNDPVFADAAYHLSANSPCRGTGSSFCAIGTDLDGEPWNSPPSMGADEVYDADFAGSLAVAIQSSQTTLLVNRSLALTGQITGRAAELAWSFGDGTFVTNVSFFTSHLWTGPGDYNVVFTAYNPDNPGGISTNLPVHVLPLDPPLLQSTSLLALSNGFQFQFDGQSNAIYTVQMTTNLAPPVVWADLQTITSTGGVVQIMDANATNATSFYRVGVQ